METWERKPIIITSDHHLPDDMVEEMVERAREIDWPVIVVTPPWKVVP